MGLLKGNLIDEKWAYRFIRVPHGSLEAFVGVSRGGLRAGTDVSIENMHHGFTHVFECTFESTEGVKEYIEHPAHLEFAKEILLAMEKTLIIDYMPTAVNNS
ncbi:Os01g0516400 [Oryza sativa Japonica Group]|uniref:Os01g0516400 protein n=1 Tax=Oryza sativa subsp. japonica TaxID=39947 RepID=Q0JMC1_ORYSJ|nr:Os01g0516400 [Oryza sativa Japonica Group]|eukprot:NP_001043193.2 Os01g0516400 [Oryza sativa Japonica Group]